MSSILWCSRQLGKGIDDTVRVTLRTLFLGHCCGVNIRARETKEMILLCM